jgi:cytochrome oxidase Cu insertion factor (SCO1/SenC/PrrC family)
MSRSRQARRAQARRSPRTRATAARGLARRRWGWAAALAVAVAIAGVVLGLHAASRPASSGSASGSGGGTSGSTAAPQAGRQAPDGTFTTLSGQAVRVASLRGKPTLLWFVSTWCSSCQVGTQVMAQNLARLKAAGVRVAEVELYQDLGQTGPSMAQFAKTLAGAAYGSPGWTFGISSAALTRTYDPQAYLDIYYLLNARGQVTYVNSSPGSTMPQLLAAAGKLS